MISDDSHLFRDLNPEVSPSTYNSTQIRREVHPRSRVKRRSKAQKNHSRRAIQNMAKER